VTVVDPGPEDPIHTDAILRALDPGEHVSHIFVTHHHIDHVGGVPDLQVRTGARSYGFGWAAPTQEKKSESFRFGDPEADAADPLSSKAEDEREKDNGPFQPDVVLRHGDVVTIGDGTLEALHTPGHASDHLCYAFAQEQLLLTGDHVMGWSTSVIPPPDGDLNAYVASLELLLDRDDTWYLPTHGPAVTRPRTLVKALLAHRRDRSQQILDALLDGPHSVVEIVPRIYGNISKQLWHGAAASLWAHVLALVDAGEVAQTEGELTRTSRIYRRS
jgi:glyoxylase-like metal-dependent hydrolase (beta-lactamase superfamily II)